MKITFFDTHHFEKDFFQEENRKYDFELQFIESRLNVETVSLARGSEAICAFVNDKLDEACISQLHKLGVQHIALRSAGFNNVDLLAAHKNNILVTRVPGYSPHAVAEFALGILLSLNRKIHRAYWRVRDLNFSLDGLVGFDLYGKKIGVLGAGKIGKIFANVLQACGCEVLIYDLIKDSELQGRKNISYVNLETLCRESDVISLHVPLTPETQHIIDGPQFEMMKPNVLIINTGRGALINSRALLEALKKEKIAGAALDVYEEEENIFFQDLSGKVLQDDLLARLLTFPNVLITSHQAFLTKEALQNIAKTTLQSIDDRAKGRSVGDNKVVFHETHVRQNLDL